MLERIGSTAFSALVLLTCLSTVAFGETYPSRPLRLIVPGAAGSQTDINVRLVAEALSGNLAQPVVVDNRPGASGIIATELAARAKPDGYTILFGNVSTLCINPAIFAKLPYDSIKDFLPVTLAVRGSPILIVNPQLPVNDLAAFIAYAKSKPGQLSYGSPGIGSIQHLGAALLQQLTGTQMVHVPYNRHPQMIVDLSSGVLHVTVEFGGLSAQHIKAGRIRAIVIAGARRKPDLPDIPTASEAGLPAFQIEGWAGYFVPAGTPGEIVAKLHWEIAAAVRSKKYTDLVASLGSEIVASTPEELAAVVKSDLERWGRVIRESGIRAD